MPSNVEIVRAMSEPMNGLDLVAVDWRSDAIRELFDAFYAPDFQLTTLESGLASGLEGGYSGMEGFAEYLEDWLEPFSEYHAELLEYIDAGDFVMVRTSQWGIGRSSGAKAELELTWLYELRNGRITRAFQYDTLEQAREAVAQLAAKP